MQNHEQLPMIDEEALDGVAGGIDVHSIADSVKAVRAATVKVPATAAGLAASFTGDVFNAMGDFWHKVGAALGVKPDGSGS
jgi:hypothetical protein